MVGLQGLSWLVVDRATWTVQSYADATADRPIESAPCSADELAQRLGLATGTIHNRKLDANRFLLTYLVAETKRYHAPDQVRTALLDTLRLLIPLVPELGTLVRQIADRGNDSASGSSSTE
ncbi:MAG: hypothetical protein H6836_09065 [Planctomycetes bacterium]|nr:hypothetical protein [Planctomycetota bacterium]